MCEKSIQDVVERFWDIIEEININKVLKFMRDNIVSKYTNPTTAVQITAIHLVWYINSNYMNTVQKLTTKLIH